MQRHPAGRLLTSRGGRMMGHSLPSHRCSCILRTAQPSSIMRREQQHAGFVRGSNSVYGVASSASLSSATTSARSPLMYQQHASRQLSSSAAAAAAPAPTVPEAGALEGGFATEREYHIAADHTFDEVQNLIEGLEDTIEDFESNLSVRMCVCMDRE